MLKHKSLSPFDWQKESEDKAREAFHGSLYVRNYDNCVIGPYKDVRGKDYEVTKCGEIRRKYVRLSKKDRRILKAELLK